MFEKEATQYQLEHATPSLYKVVGTAFQAGAEFGYNKANEWHYVKDGDFPKDRTEEKYLVALKSEYGGFFYETDIWCESLHCFASNNPIKVYAWKEIVIPKE